MSRSEGRQGQVQTPPTRCLAVPNHRGTGEIDRQAPKPPSGRPNAAQRGGITTASAAPGPDASRLRAIGYLASRVWWREASYPHTHLQGWDPPFSSESIDLEYTQSTVNACKGGGPLIDSNPFPTSIGLHKRCVGSRRRGLSSPKRRTRGGAWPAGLPRLIEPRTTAVCPRALCIGPQSIPMGLIQSNMLDCGLKYWAFGVDTTPCIFAVHLKSANSCGCSLAHRGAGR